MIDPRSDAELLSALRAGDRGSYEALWHRHADAARGYAYRLFPARADDLVSESFLAIYQQVTTTDKGPQFAFRSYLKTVIRNTAIAWRKDAERVLTSDRLRHVLSWAAALGHRLLRDPRGAVDGGDAGECSGHA